MCPNCIPKKDYPEQLGQKATLGIYRRHVLHRPAWRDILADVWQRHNAGQPRVPGLINRVWETLEQLQRTWPAPPAWVTDLGTTNNFLKDPEKWVWHELQVAQRRAKAATAAST